MTVRRCLSKFGSDATKITAAFLPQMTAYYLSKGGEERMVMSEIAPTLTVIRMAYGIGVLREMLGAFLLDSARWHGISRYTRNDQLYDIADVILTDHYDLKITEVMLFFSLLKRGKLRDDRSNDVGRMYGTFSGQTIMEALYRFRQYRNDIIDRVENEVRRRRIDAIDDGSKPVAELLKEAGCSSLAEYAQKLINGKQ